MKKTMNLKKLKTQKKVCGLGFVGSLALCSYGFINLVKEKISGFSDVVNNDPDQISVFREVFEKYDCENYAEFKTFLSDNSTTFTDWVYVDGVPQQITVTRYNQFAQPAYNEFTSLQHSLNELPITDQLLYLGIDGSDLAMFAIVPAVFAIAYGYKKHQYKKACKRAKQASLELAEMEKQQ